MKRDDGFRGYELEWAIIFAVASLFLLVAWALKDSLSVVIFEDGSVVVKFCIRWMLCGL